MLQDGAIDDAVLLAALAEAEVRWPGVLFAALRLRGGNYRIIARQEEQSASRDLRPSVLTRPGAPKRLGWYCRELVRVLSTEHERGPPAP
jgi:hypothetical protein